MGRVVLNMPMLKVMDFPCCCGWPDCKIRIVLSDSDEIQLFLTEKFIVIHEECVKKVSLQEYRLVEIREGMILFVPDNLPPFKRRRLVPAESGWWKTNMLRELKKDMEETENKRLPDYHVDKIAYEKYIKFRNLNEKA